MHELRITQFFNHVLGGFANALLNALHVPAQDPRYPWTDAFVCEVIVFLFLLIFFGFMRTRFSVDRPGKVQHVLEIFYDFFHASADEIVGHDGQKHVPFFGTIFIFVLILNLSGLIPGLDSPTMYPWVPFGLAVATFIYYHASGLKAQGAGYFKQFLGPMLVLAPLMLPIELISHFARPLSLTVRLFANMFAGEQVFLTFLGLTKIIIPVVFIALHAFAGLLQAYIFMMLAMVYVGGAVSHEH